MTSYLVPIKQQLCDSIVSLTVPECTVSTCLYLIVYANNNNNVLRRFVKTVNKTTTMIS